MQYTGSAWLTASAFAFMWMGMGMCVHCDNVERCAMITIGCTSVWYHSTGKHMIVDMVAVHICGGYLMIANAHVPWVVACAATALVCSLVKPQTLRLERSSVTEAAAAAVAYHFLCVHLPSLVGVHLIASK